MNPEDDQRTDRSIVSTVQKINEGVTWATEP